jgi:hypothetical protein
MIHTAGFAICGITMKPAISHHQPLSVPAARLKVDMAIVSDFVASEENEYERF